MEMDQFPMKKSSPSSSSSSEKPHSRTKRQAPYIIFPEILCIIDYDGYRYTLKHWAGSVFRNLKLNFGP
jgi:hypothetical protein